MKLDLVEKITKNQIRTDLPEFRVGDTIRGSGISKTFVVRKKSSGIGVERTFPMNSPIIDSITVVRKGKVRQAKLGYLRTLVSQPKIKERRDKVDTKKAA